AGAATAAQRIVSLNPVATELLFAAGVGARVVGRTRWDMYPSEARAVPDLGDGINPNIEAVVAAKPDLVVLYAGATNVRAARSLRAAGIATVSVRTDRLGDLVRLSRLLAAAMGDSSVAIAADSVASSVAKVRATPPRSDSLRALWYLGEPPIYVIGAGSYMSELLDAAGAVNVFADVEAPSPEVSMEAIIARDPDVIIAGPTAAARLRRSAAWQSLRAVREGRVVVADTALVGRPGVRMGEAARHVRDALAQLPAGAARMGKP
ncbi:MAG: hypothetical protein FJ202_12065, partial [Gemmatimonadetes bacterium]|nr:hypothetical protein [Gemmatimonadota bacterium]